MGITGSIKKDILLLMAPSWALIYLFHNYSNIFYDPYVAWFILFFFQFFEIIHELTTIPRVLNTKSENFKKNLKYFGAGILLVTSFIGYIHYYGFLYFFIILLPLSALHDMKQTIGILKWYFHINQRYCKITIFFYILNFLIVGLLVLSDGTRHVPLGLVINAQYSSYIFFSLICVNLLRFVFEIFLYLKHSRVELNRIAYLSHSMIGSAFLMLIAKDYIWGYVFIVFNHSIQYLVISTHSRLKLDKHYKIHNYHTKIIVTLVILSVMAIGIDMYDFKINYLYDYAHKSLRTNKGMNISISAFKDNIYLSVLIGISFIPWCLHYFYDLFIWKKSYSEAKIVYSKEE